MSQFSFILSIFAQMALNQTFIHPNLNYDHCLLTNGTGSPVNFSQWELGELSIKKKFLHGHIVHSRWFKTGKAKNKNLISIPCWLPSSSGMEETSQHSARGGLWHCLLCTLLIAMSKLKGTAPWFPSLPQADSLPDMLPSCLCLTGS